MKSIIERKLKSFDQNELNSGMDFWSFYQVRNLIQFSKGFREVRNKLWKEHLHKIGNAELRLMDLVYKDRLGIYAYLRKIDEELKESEEMGDLWKEGRIGVASFEY